MFVSLLLLIPIAAGMLALWLVTFLAYLVWDFMRGGRRAQAVPDVRDPNR